MMFPEGAAVAVKLDDGASKFQVADPSNWKCYMFGNRPGGSGMVYYPAKGMVPNAFVRFMMRICFGCVWVKSEPLGRHE
jgi:hypothetical protein